MDERDVKVLDELRWMRRAALRRRAPADRSLVLPTGALECGRGALQAFKAQVEAQYPQDLVFVMDVPSLLADRCSISRAVLRSLLNSDGARWLKRLRGAVAKSRDARSWFFEHTDLSHDGAVRVHDALSKGEAAALTLLKAHHDPMPELLNGEPYVPPSKPLGEEDARALVTFMVELLKHDGGVWFLLSNLETLLIDGGCVLSRAFLEGLRRWWQHMLESLPGAVLVTTCWSGACGRLDRLGRGAVAWLRQEVGEAAPLARIEAHALSAALGKALAPVDHVQHRQDLGGWMYFAKRGGGWLIWPGKSRSPARDLNHSVGDVAEIFGGGTVSILAPRWCFGDEGLMDRQATSKAYVFVRWVPLPCSVASLLCGDEPLPSEVADWLRQALGQARAV